jgi:hypothetical protein
MCRCPEGCKCGNCKRCTCPCDEREDLGEKDMVFDDSVQTKKYASEDSLQKRANTTGLKTVSSDFNNPILSSDTTFNERYQNLISQEIGASVMDSHSKYVK